MYEKNNSTYHSHMNMVYLLKKLENFKEDIEKTEYNFLSSLIAEKCNRLLKEAKELLGEKIKDAKEIKTPVFSKKIADKAEVLMKITEIIEVLADEV